MSNASYAGRAGAAGEPFSIGRAFGGATSTFQQGFGKFIGMTGIAHIPLLIVGIIAASSPGAAGVGMLIAVLIGLVVGPITTAACLFGAFQIKRGRDFSIGEAFSVALSRFWPLLGASLLGGLLTFVGLLLLIVPGFICLCMIFVAQPACVIEKLGPVTSLSRSRELTKGYRWQIFGLLVILTVASIVLGGVLGAIFGIFAGAIGGAIAQFLIQVLVGAYSAVLYSVSYSGLREAKEGVDVDQLARVFD